MTPNPDTMDNVEFAQRLIEWSYDTRCMGWIDQDLRNAAARIVQARAEIERLREALEPFAKIDIGPLPHDEAVGGRWVARTIYCNDQVTAHSVLKARSALTHQGE